MKRIVTFLLFVSTFAFVFAQPVPQRDGWLKRLQSIPSSQLILRDYQEAFNEYWKPFNVVRGFYEVNGKKIKASGWKQFKRWEYAAEMMVDGADRFPQKTAVEVVNEFRSLQTPVQRVFNLFNDGADWQPQGPTASEGGYAGIGRINYVAFHPTDNNTYWVGAASGGLWGTADNGVSWRSLTDMLGVLSVSGILISPDFTNDQTLYLATGDKNTAYGESTYSIGVVKSTDGGISWNDTGLKWSLIDCKHIYRLLMDPNDKNTLYVATSNGVQKSIDGGTTFTPLLMSEKLYDMEFKPNDSQVLYGTGIDGIFKTTDGGQSWNCIYDYPRLQRKDDGTEIDCDRAELAVDPSDPDFLYCVSSLSTGGLNGVLKSEDAGATWTPVLTDKNILGRSFNGIDATENERIGGQANYDLTIEVHPTLGYVYVGGVHTWRSIDGGNTWEIVNFWANNDQNIEVVHADKHCIAFRPSDNLLFECNDGGVYLNDVTQTKFVDKTNGMQISQIYKLAINPNNRSEILCGLQDNGSKHFRDGLWRDVTGGDGMDCAIDPVDGNIQYTTYANGELYLTMDSWGKNGSDYQTITPKYLNERGESVSLQGMWVTPVLLNPKDPQIVYAAYDRIVRSNDRGGNWLNGKSIEDLGVISSLEMLYKDGYRSMAISVSDTAVIYAANDELKIYRTDNSGRSWSDITNGLPYPIQDGAYAGNKITSIAVDYADSQQLWIAFSGYGSQSWRVAKGSQGGEVWEDISAGLPPLPIYSLVQDSITGILYAGTELGVYSKKENDSWQLYSNGLPNVKVSDLKIYYAKDHQQSLLKAGTYGRGLWDSPLIPQDPSNIPSSSTLAGDDTYNLFVRQQQVYIAHSVEAPIGYVEIFSTGGERLYHNEVYTSAANIPVQASDMIVVRITNEGITHSYKLVMRK